MAQRRLTTLATILREAGLRVVEIAGWEDRSRPSSTGDFHPVGVLWHHTGPGVSGLKGAKWMALDGRSDLPAPLVQLSIDRDGTVYVLAAGRANHAGVAKASGTVAAGDGNALYIGVECMNSGTEGWSTAQYGAMVKTGAALAHLLGTSVNAQRGHKETSTTGKWDPGALDMDKFRRDIAARLALKSKPVPPKKTPHLVIATGNLFKDNTHKPEDVALLDEQHAHVFGLNEAFRFHGLLEGLKNYQVVSPGTGPALNNPVLIRNGLKVTGSGSRSMCAKVGSSPERTAVWAEYEFAGKRWAHVQTHSNAHIENGGQPRILPRVTQNVAHMKNLDVLVRSLKAQGFKVTVGGDFNWAWTANPKAWTWAPKRVFSRLGMYVNWANRTAPKLASLGSRRVDYLAHGRDDLRIVSQRYVTGEHSDHRWPEVTYRVL